MKFVKYLIFSLSTSLSASVTYFKDVQPIVEGRCQICHSTTGVSFSFENPQVVMGFGPAMVKAVSERRMPPWLAEKGHRAYKDDYSLTNKEIRTFEKWQDNKFTMGKPLSQPETPESIPSSNFEPDLSLLVNHGKPYLPYQDRKDDYHCFMMKWPAEQRNYITGFRARPANSKVAHHLVLFSAPPELVPILEELESQETRPGYQCFGGGYPDRISDPQVAKALEAKFPNAVERLNQGIQWVAHWAPGMDGYDFPQETGIPVKPGSVMIVQMHYFSAYAPGEFDQGSVMEFKIADQVQKPGFNLPLTNSAWLLGKKNGSMVIPPQSEASYQTSVPMEYFSQKAARYLNIDTSRIESLELHSANLHMHAIGKSGRIYIQDQWGWMDTVLNIPRWDLNWQRDFAFENSLTFDRKVMKDKKMVVECTFLNFKDTSVYGGFGSDDEMCFNFSYFVFNLEDQLVLK